MGFSSPTPTDPSLPSKDYGEETQKRTRSSNAVKKDSSVQTENYEVGQQYHVRRPSRSSTTPSLVELAGSSGITPAIKVSAHEKMSRTPPTKRQRTNEDIDNFRSESKSVSQSIARRQPSQSHTKTQIEEPQNVTSDLSQSSLEEEIHSGDENTIETQKSPQEPPVTVMGGISPLLERQLGGQGFAQQPLFAAPTPTHSAATPAVTHTSPPSQREYMPYWQMFPSPTPPSYEYPDYQMLPQYYYVHGGRQSSASPSQVARITEESALRSADPSLQRSTPSGPRYVPLPTRSGHESQPVSPYPSNYGMAERWDRHRPRGYRTITGQPDAVTISSTSESQPGPTSRAAFAAAAAAATSYHSIDTPNLEVLPSPSIMGFVRTSALYQAASSWGVGSGSSSQHMSQVAKLVIDGNLNSIAANWTHQEEVSGRRIVWFTRYQEGPEVRLRFRVIQPDEWTSEMTAISCIFERKKRMHYVTSVDCITLLELIIDQKFSVEEKNRIRRNLEVCKPTTISKNKPELAQFFSLIMSFAPPRPRNIEKDVKVFPWSMLEGALKKIVSKYSLGRRQDNRSDY